MNLPLTDRSRHRNQDVKDANLQIGIGELVTEDCPHAPAETLIQGRRRIRFAGMDQLEKVEVGNFHGKTMDLNRPPRKLSDWVFD